MILTYQIKMHLFIFIDCITSKLETLWLFVTLYLAAQYPSLLVIFDNIWYQTHVNLVKPGYLWQVQTMHSVKTHDIDAIIYGQFNRILAPLQQETCWSLLPVTPVRILRFIDTIFRLILKSMLSLHLSPLINFLRFPVLDQCLPRKDAFNHRQDQTDPEFSNK